MDTPSAPEYPERMSSFMTTEHFTLQSARGILNGEIMSRVNIYFTTLGSVLIASAFLAQVPEMNDLFELFTWIAFPVAIHLGVFTLARLMVLGRTDFVYIRAINRIRQFYVQAAPEMERFLLFPPHDDDRSAHVYGGYATNFRGNLLSAAHAVSVTNSIVATVVLSAAISSALGMTAARFLPFGLGILVVVYVLHGFIGFALAKKDLEPDHLQARFPAPQPGPPAGESSEMPAEVRRTADSG
ncbi:MAG TPA: hypothetical protein VLC52_01155 [Anaerolineae bacterium]|nr:hypothetical protein [Anaerolineae bacterium]